MRLTTHEKRRTGLGLSRGPSDQLRSTNKVYFDYFRDRLRTHVFERHREVLKELVHNRATYNLARASSRYRVRHRSLLICPFGRKAFL